LCDASQTCLLHLTSACNDFHKYVTKLTHNVARNQIKIANLLAGSTMARRILVVEDEAPIREMVCFVLEQNGYHAVEAEDYDSAVSRLIEPFPELILLDWMLPGGSGIQFIKHLKREALTREIPVMMLTARGEEEDRVRGLEVGADDYITKPFSPKELVARIKAVMRRISPMAVEISC